MADKTQLTFYLSFSLKYYKKLFILQTRKFKEQHGDDTRYDINNDTANP